MFLILPLGGALFLFAGADEMNGLPDLMRGSSIGIVLLCFTSYFLIYLVDSFRLKIMLGSLNQFLPFRDRFTNSILGNFYTNITPFAAGGQPYQIYHLRTSGIPVDRATALISIRLLDHLGASVLVSAATLIFIAFSGTVHFLSYAFDSIMIAGLGVSCGATLLLILALLRSELFLPPLVRLLHKFGRQKAAVKMETFASEIAVTLRILRNKRKLALAADFGLGLVNLCLQGFSLWFSLNSLAESIPNPLIVTMLYILINLIVYLLPTPGASGGVEGGYTVFFNYFADDLQTVAAAVFLWRFATFYLHILLQLVYYYFLRKKANPLPEESFTVNQFGKRA
ncbi:MAG: flippase-like domain-containing protein [Spirochaetales bacterium]|nr:flippase-like domain-containing protein [Spirochaetales bacterium]